jgi:hypothetical protein
MAKGRGALSCLSSFGDGATKVVSDRLKDLLIFMMQNKIIPSTTSTTIVVKRPINIADQLVSLDAALFLASLSPLV